MSPQLLNALKDVFPFARQHKAASTLTVALETLFIEAEAEWQSIHNGKIPADEIVERRMKLQKHKLDLEQRCYPDGFEPGQRLIKLAESEAATYFELTYSKDA